MATRWTEEQRSAIDLRQRNILVSAAAGSGKTAVLVERIFSMLTDRTHPIDIDQLLVVTFTNAAAAEMKERVEDRLQRSMDEDPDNDHVLKQLASIHSAQIMTIHSFCLYVIRNHFNEIDLDPAFRIGEETELKLLRGDVMEKLLETYYEADSSDFTDFVECFAKGKMDNGISELVLQVYEYSRSYPWPDRWLDACLESFAVADSDALESLPAVAFLKEYLQKIIGEVEISALEALKLCRDDDGPVHYGDMIAGDLKIIEQLKVCVTLADYYNAFSDLKFAALSRKKMPEAAEEKKNQVKNLRDFVKKTLTDLKKSYFSVRPAVMAENIRRMYPKMAVLVQLVKEFSEKYQQAKEAKNTVDFGDLEHFALKILIREEAGEIIPTSAALELSHQYEEILIDEYQDSNQVQETILTSISRERAGHPNVFMVGDVKQSIYKFRLAKPELFMEKYGSYSLDDSQYQRIDLHKNFRSRPEVLDGVNFLFRRLMTKDLGDIEYDDDAALYAGASFPEFEGASSAAEPAGAVRVPECASQDASKAGSSADVAESAAAKCGHRAVDVQVLLIHPGDDEESAQSADNEDLTSQELEAQAVALRIHELVDGPEPLYVIDKESGSYRKAVYGDMVILLRTMSGWADTFVKVLNQENIPAQAETVTGFFTASEIQVVLSYLSIVDNPRQDIPLAAVLRSPIGSFNDEELAMIRSLRRKRQLYDSCMAFCQEESTMFLERNYTTMAIAMVRQRLREFFERLDRLRSLVPYTPIHELILKIYEETGYYAWASAMPGGMKRRANLDMLVEKAVDYEATSYRGLFNFTRYIDQLKKYEVDFGEAPVADGFINTVRIMSIHKSKGLEYPVVFVSGLGKNFNQQDARSSLIIHSEFGFGPDVIDTKWRLKAPTLLKKILARKTLLENLGEELRVLYVALTRAKEQLILTGFVKDMDKALDRWCRETPRNERRISFGAKAGAGCFLDWIMSVLVHHHSAHELLNAHKHYSPLFHPDYDNRTAFDIREITMEALFTTAAEKSADYMLKKDALLHWNSQKTYVPEMHRLMPELLRWEYPFAKEVRLHAVMTVSELKRLSQLQDAAEDVDSEVMFAEGGAYEAFTDEGLEAANASATCGGLEAAEGIAADGTKEPAVVPAEETKQARMERAALRGTTVHRLLERMDIDAIHDISDVNALADTLMASGQITAQGRELVYIPSIYRFAKSQLARRMQTAQARGQLYRERQFVMGVPPSVIDPGQDAQDMVLIQGIIDAWFIEDGAAVIVDYKTDFAADDGRSLIDRYKTQLDYYALAVEQMTGMQVKEKIIYSLSLSKELHV